MTEGVYVHLLDMHEVRRHEKLRLLHMHRGRRCLSAEHDWGGQIKTENLGFAYV